MATVSYSASLRTRKTSSSSDAKSDRACQEFYSDDYNYVGIIHFSGMDLRNKIITGVSIKATSASAGYGSSHTKTVYLRKSNYQAAAASGVTGSGMQVLRWAPSMEASMGTRQHVLSRVHC